MGKSLEEPVSNTLRLLAAELGLSAGQLFGVLRVAITGRTAAPPLFQTMAVLGKACCIKRISVALAKLNKKEYIWHTIDAQARHKPPSRNLGLLKLRAIQIYLERYTRRSQRG